LFEIYPGAILGDMISSMGRGKSNRVNQTATSALLSTHEAAQRLYISDETLRRWTKEKKLPLAQTTKGGHRRYYLSDVLALAADQSSKDTITEVHVSEQTYPAVWSGNLTVYTDGDKVWHTAEYEREGLRPRPLSVRVHDAIERGKTFTSEISDPPKLAAGINEKGDCIISADFHSTGQTRKAVESDIKEALTRIENYLSKLEARKGISHYVLPDGKTFDPGDSWFYH
jgi:excisionase family DNA binding protein